MSKSSWKHQLDGDPDGPIDGDAEEISQSLEVACKCVPDYFNQKLNLLESEKTVGKQIIRKELYLMVVFNIGYLCRNYKLGYLNQEQIKIFEVIMLEFSLLAEKLKKNKIKIPSFVTEQLIAMGCNDPLKGRDRTKEKL